MPLQNRVTPFGELIATPARGMLMGNRGCLHDEQQRIKRLFQVKRWISCKLAFKQRRRVVMQPGHYTELFFLDEATALAAGHRPCAECSRMRYTQFRTMWAEANDEALPSAEVMDAVLHRERLDDRRCKRTYEASLSALPDGAFVALDHTHAHLLWEARLWLWSPGGYTLSEPTLTDRLVQVLTPPTIVRILAQGYRPSIHSSVWSSPLVET